MIHKETDEVCGRVGIVVDVEDTWALDYEVGEERAAL